MESVMEFLIILECPDYFSTKPVIVDMGEEADSSGSASDKPRVRIQSAPTGTTWVFDDGGSQVVHTKGSSKGPESAADFLDDFEEKIAEEKSNTRDGPATITPQSNQEFMDDFADEFAADV